MVYKIYAFRWGKEPPIFMGNSSETENFFKENSCLSIIESWIEGNRFIMVVSNLKN